MKKLLLLVGLVVFLTPMVVNAETVFKSELPKCKIKNNEIKSKKPCYGKIVYGGGNVYEGEFGSRKGRDGTIKFYYEGIGTKTFIDGTVKSGRWKNDIFLDEVSNETDTQTTINKITGYIHCQRPNGKVYKSSLGCSINKTITKEEFLTLSKKFYCEKLNGEVYYSSTCKNDKEITKSRYIKLKKQNELKLANERKKIAFAYEESSGIDQNSRRSCFDHATGNRISCGVALPKKKATFDELAISLGCGIKRKDVKDCVRRYLPSIAGTGPMTLEQIEEVKKDKELMGEVVFAIEEMNRANSQSNEPSQQEQARAEEGYYKEQSNGNYVWVDTRSGAEKFTDRFCYNCSAAQVYMINRATKRYFQGAPLSGFDKFILRGGNTSKVIKFYK